MSPERKYPILKPLLKPYRWTQRKTLGLVIAAIIEAGSARSFEIASVLSMWLGIRFDSALNRFYRLLRNWRIETFDLSKGILALLASRIELVIAVDWTEWHDEMRMLVASVVCGKRAVPVQASTFNRQTPVRSQN